MRRLVFVTQAVDPAHPVLAATIPKMRALAARVDELVVLAQSASDADLPANVRVQTFGAATRLRRLARFERELARALPADAVVAHMIPVYVVLAAPLVRPRRIPLLLWYTHWKASHSCGPRSGSRRRSSASTGARFRSSRRRCARSGTVST